eukprot:tig00000342_g24224.t1
MLALRTVASTVAAAGLRMPAVSPGAAITRWARPRISAIHAIPPCLPRSTPVPATALLHLRSLHISAAAASTSTASQEFMPSTPAPSNAGVDILPALPPSISDREVWVTTLSGEPVEIIRLAGAVFGVPIRRDIVQRVVIWQLAIKRRGHTTCKNRSQVRGSSRKIVPQKGRGGARHGTIRANIFRKGGKAMGPVPRSFHYTLPKKIRRAGMKVALSAKAAEGNLAVIDSLHFDSHKTREFVAAVAGRGWTSALMMDVTVDGKLYYASRNVPGFNLRPAREATVYDILRHKTLVLSKAAVRFFEERLTAPIKR